MEDKQRFKAEMFMRVSDIGVAEGAFFPLTSLGGRLFADLNVVRAELDAESVKQASGKSSAEQGTTSRGEAREDVREDIEAITRTARSMSEDIPGVEDKFRMPPANISDQALIAAARAIARDAVEYKASFIEYGLHPEFLEDLESDISVFEGAINRQETARRQRVMATAAIDDIIERGMKIVRRLDAIVRNKFRDDAAKLAAWTRARHVERPARRKKELPPPPPANP